MVHSGKALAFTAAALLLASPAFAQTTTPGMTSSPVSPFPSPSISFPSPNTTIGGPATGGIPGTLGGTPYRSGGNVTGGISGTLGGTPAVFPGANGLYTPAPTSVTTGTTSSIGGTATGTLAGTPGAFSTLSTPGTVGTPGALGTPSTTTPGVGLPAGGGTLGGSISVPAR